MVQCNNWNCINKGLCIKYTLKSHITFHLYDWVNHHLFDGKDCDMFESKYKRKEEETNDKQN